MGVDEIITKAHNLGFDYKQLLDEGMTDLVGQTEPDEPLVVSSSLNEDLSE